MTNSNHFRGLNELRALAALAVVFYHIELYKNRIQLPSLYDISFINPFFNYFGKSGVYLFFVLSGFLLTHILTTEKKNNAQISFKNFYLRRILRIWPLYFIVGIIGFIIIPFLYYQFTSFFQGQDHFNLLIENLNYKGNLLFYFFFLTNISIDVYGPIAGAGQTWSVCVEEQVYIIWPWIINLFYKHLHIAFILLTILFILLQFNIRELTNNHTLIIFIETFHIDMMAIGGLFALGYSKFQNIIKLNTPLSLFIIIGSILIHIFFQLPVISLSILYGFLILSLHSNHFNLNLLNRIGKWSYGIYMYHPLFMYLSFSLVFSMNIQSVLYANLLYYSMTIGLTLVTSFLSYNYIELFFLNKKQYFNSKFSSTK